MGQGSEFEVRLPLTDGLVLPTAPSEGDQTVPVPARRILVVDDNRDAAESLSEVLQFAGHQTRIAHDGLDAVRSAAAFKPHLVLLDIGLPKLNGYEVARRIREEQWGKDMMLVALTGWGQHEDRQKSSQAGFDSHLVKPVSHDQLQTLLRGMAAASR
jgi:CheY-like chemotaxis protein